MLINPLPPINKVFSLLIQQERQVLLPQEYEKLLTAFSKPFLHRRPLDNKPKNFSFGRGRGIKICTYYNKPDRTIKFCFKKHGLSPYLKKPIIANITSKEFTQQTIDTSPCEDLLT